MQLISLEFNDPNSGWSLDKVSFFPDVTLLVGLSGVGKTRILNSVRKLVTIANGKTSAEFSAIKWSLEFRHKGDLYKWRGEFGSSMMADEKTTSVQRRFFEEDEDSPKPSLISEELSREGVVVAHREGTNILLDGKPTPKLSNKESLINILKNEESILGAFEAMDSILFVDHSEEHRSGRFFSFARNFESLKKKLVTIEQIRDHDLPTHIKLALARQNCPDVFDEISSQFQEAFPYVEEIDIEFVEVGPFGVTPQLFMKEIGVEQRISEDAISSGMHRTLMHLSRMMLWPDGTVVLIDEFENSFGVNCIHFVTQDLQFHSQRMQFVLTSHHPYIINNISMKNWKIVSRKGPVVVVEGAEQLQKNTSHHEAFLQLMNLPQYSEGIASE